MFSLRIFLLIKLYGTDLIANHIHRTYDLAKSFASVIDRHPNFEHAVTPDSNIVCFRWIAKIDKLNQCNLYIRDHLLRDGEYYIVQTKLDNTIWLRLTIMNPLTKLAILEELLIKIDSLAKSFIAAQ